MTRRVIDVTRYLQTCPLDNDSNGGLFSVYIREYGSSCKESIFSGVRTLSPSRQSSTSVRIDIFPPSQTPFRSTHRGSCLTRRRSRNKSVLVVIAMTCVFARTSISSLQYPKLLPVVVSTWGSNVCKYGLLCSPSPHCSS